MNDYYRMDLNVQYIFSQCFTILWQEPEIQALQVLNAEQQWIDAPPIPGTLVIKQVNPTCFTLGSL